jgi:hypothetical protein
MMVSYLAYISILKMQVSYFSRNYLFPTKYTALYKIWSINGGDYEEYRLLGCYAVWIL